VAFGLVALLAAPPPAARAEAAVGRSGALDRRAGGWLAPGPLARGHGDLERLSGCTECHAPLGGTPDSRCLDCHEDVADRMRERVGVHGSFEGPCAGCHGEHRGVDADLLGLDREAFNHDRARFALRGAHQELACETCHTRVHPETGREGFHPFLLRFERCADCHEDPHGETFVAGRACEACHDASAWSALASLRTGQAGPVAFVHDRDTRFPLEGRHAGLACPDCHTPERRAVATLEDRPPGRGTPDACAACHDDVHEGALGSGCDRCHAPVAWKGPDAVFDHARQTRFPLDALHAGLACRSCHDGPRFAAEGRRCEACHGDAAALLAGRLDRHTGPPDPHHESLECRDCHPADLATAGLLDHERACLRCHPEPYGRLLVTRKRRLDDLVVRSETALRRLTLAAERGEGRAPDAAQAELLSRVARSGLHNPELGEALLRELLLALEAGEGSKDADR
jgi:hypothetical protein